MAKIRTIFALVPEMKFRLPVSAEIVGVEVTNDVSRFVMDTPDETVTPDGQIRPEVPRQEVTIKVYMEGETRGTGTFTGEPGNEKETMEEIPIPEESETLRKIASFETVESPAKWHVFQVLQPVS